MTQGDHALTSRDTEVTDTIRELVTSMGDAWNRNDMKSFDSIFSEDVDFVDTAGRRFKGRDAIEVEHIRERELAPTGIEMEMEDLTISSLRDDIAVVHIGSNLRPANRRAIMTAIFMKQDGEWHVRVAANTITT